MKDQLIHGYTMTASAVIDPGQALALLHTTYWGGERTLLQMIKTMEHSLNFGLLDEAGMLRGYMRVVTDYTTMFYLADVVVDDALRGQGLGLAFLKYVLADERISGKGMLLTRDAQAFYEHVGFTRQGDRMMLREAAAPIKAE